jgi:hypothetical protein
MRKHPCRFSTANCTLALLMLGAVATNAAAEPTFITFDSRLPNPEQPYVMTSGTVNYESPQLYDLKFWVTNPAQLDTPSPVTGGYAFDSTFDVAFDAVMSFSLEPPHPVSGVGTAHVTGFAPSGTEPVFVFDTELVALDLVGTSPVRGGFLLRESPTLESSGVTRVEGACFGFVCPAVVLPMRVSSFFDIHTELSTNGGATWQPARDNELVHVVQVPEPATIGLFLLSGLAACCGLRREDLATLAH